MDTRIQAVLNYIDLRLHEPLTIGELAAAAALSASRLRQLFQHETGLAPVAYVRRKRMERALMLLEHTSLSVTQVMAQVGVADPSHFARDFRRAHGCSPRTLRGQLRARDRPGALPWRASPR